MSFLRLSLCGLVLSLACTTEHGIDAFAPTAAPEEPLVTAMATRSAAATAGPTILWTAPPTAKPAPTVAPTPVPIPPAAPSAPPITPVAPATPRSVRSPAPTPSPTPTGAAASPTGDPFRWTGYRVNDGLVVYVPAAWTALDPASLKGLFAFAASPEQRPSIGGAATLLTLNYVTIAAPDMTVETFADKFQQSLLRSAQVVRDRATFPAGPVVFLKYQPLGSGASVQHMDAVLVARGRGYIIGMQAPTGRWQHYAPTFAQILQRFRPG